MTDLSSTPSTFRAPLVRDVRSSSWAVFAEQEVRVVGTQIIGTAFFGFATYMNGGMVRSYTEVGRYTSIGRDVSLGLAVHNHLHLSTSPFFDLPTPRDEARLVSTEPLRRAVIGHDCWIGDSAKVMSGVRIGHGAIVATSAVVTKDVEPYAIVAGVPARHVRWRFDEDVRQRLLASEWWAFAPEALRELVTTDTQSSLEAIEEAARDVRRFPTSYSHLRAATPPSA